MEIDPLANLFDDTPDTAQPGISLAAIENEGDDLFGDDFAAPQIEATMPMFSLDDPMTGLTEEEQAQRQALEYEELPGGEVPLQGPTETIASLWLINLPTPRSTHRQFWNVKLPSFLSIDSKPFHPSNWAPSPEQDAKIPDENVIRWRWMKDPSTGKNFRQSNARLIKWDDGAWSAQIGSEIFDVTAHVDSSGSPAYPGGAPQGLTYLASEHSYAGVLEVQARITGTMSITPTTIQSKAHRRLANAVSSKHQKVQKTKLQVLENDPEFEAFERERKEKEKEREAKKAAKDAGRGSRSSRRAGRGSLRSRRLDLDSDEDDMDEDMDEETRQELARNQQRDREDMNDFIEEDMDEDEDEASTLRQEGSSSRRATESMQIDDSQRDDLDDMEARAERAARRARAEKKKAAAPQTESTVPAPAPSIQASEPTTVVKKRLVIEESDEE